MLKEKLEEVLKKLFEEKLFENCFLVDIVLSKSGRTLQVFVEHDDGINFRTCQKISRHLENYIEEQNLMPSNYVLEVSSPGIETPIKLKRQYRVHEGKQIKMKMKNGEEHLGKITEVLEDKIRIEKKIKINRTKNKIEAMEFDINAINEAVIQVSF